MADLPRLLHVAVTLAPPLHERVRAIPLEVRGQVEEALAALLSDLGVDAQPVVLLRDGSTAEPVISLRVAGVPCRFPVLRVGEAFSYVTGTAQVPDASAVPGALGELRPGQAAELIALVCRTAVSGQPELLAGPAMNEPAKEALRLGASLAGIGALPAEVAGDAEQLIAALATKAITVQVEPGLHRELTSADGAAEKFRFLRDGMFVELGLPLPAIALRPDPSLRPGGFAARFGAVRLRPRVALADGTIMVNEAPDNLGQAGVEALPTLNPGTHQPAALVAARHQEALEQRGHTTWDRIGHVILSLAQDIREHEYRLMTSDVATEMTRRLGLWSPVLEGAAARHLPPGSLARVLRELLADQVSIRNLRRIVETLLRVETSRVAGVVPDRVTAVRAGLAGEIAAKVSRQTGTVVVYLLDKDATHAVAAMDSDESPGEPGKTAARIAAGLRAELARLPPTVPPPAVLTSDETRAPLARVLRPEFPRLTVLGMGDLPPDCNVQPVARVSLG